MKKIVTLLSAALVLLAGASAFAQTSVGAGYLSSVNVNKSGNSSEALNGFYAGVGFTVPITAGINFTPGLYYGYITKSNASNFGSIASASGKLQEHYVNIPLHFSYSLDLSQGFRLFAYAGPSASIGVASTYTLSGNVAGISGSSKTDNYKDGSNYNRFDVMLGGGVGLEFNDMIRFQVGYDWGMLNRYNSDNVNVHRNQLTAGVAFLF